ncbi:MAG: serine hydrolase [Beijerinckiaceae bacterium]|nr:serine hydrolase [Beijerinckiaceae bacterium]
MKLFRTRATFGALSLFTGAAALAASVCGVQAAPTLVVDVSSGAVLHAEEATRPWYPASLTKLMTVYVALRAVHEGRVSLQTPLVVSNRAARMAPSKMGFKSGTEVTLENALKMIMVKSANDVSVTIAEGVAGSVEKFSAEMNQVASALGMRQSHFVNPNGLHHDAHVSSAQDMAVLARALLIHFPQHQTLYGIGALKLGTKIIPTHNGLLGRYPGADGMKTGFVCASGFNVVASATRGGRRIITVVMGSPNAKTRTLKAMSLFEQGFAVSNFGRTTLAQLPPSGVAEAPNMRSQICGPGRNRDSIGEDFGVSVAGLQNPGTNFDEGGPAAFFQQQRMATSPALAALATGDLGPRPVFDPVPIYIGRAPGWAGSARAALTDDASDAAATKPAGGRTHPATQANPHKPLPVAKPKAAEKKQQAAKPAAKKQQGAKATQKPTQKPAAKAAQKPAPKPAPKPAAKAKTDQKPKAAQKPAPKAAPKPQASATPSAVQ